jgi:anti-anti-sigma regulatory factor
VVSVEAMSSVTSGGFRVVVERTLPVAIVRPRGQLDADTAAQLRAALISSLAQQPAGVLVEGSELVVVDDRALAVLASVALESSHWPGVPLVVSGPPATVAAVDRLRASRYIRTCPDESAALAVLHRSPVPPSRRQQIEPDRDAPAMARLAVREFCAEQSLGGDGDAAQLVASELVTNAVIHAGTTMEFTLRYVSPLLHIAVCDGSGQVPRIHSIVDENAESGRGLLLVDALATAWGSLVPDSGKVVWATVRVRSLATTSEAPL